MLDQKKRDRGLPDLRHMTRIPCFVTSSGALLLHFDKTDTDTNLLFSAIYPLVIGTKREVLLLSSPLFWKGLCNIERKRKKREFIRRPSLFDLTGK